MTKRKKPRVKCKTGLVGMGEETEIEALKEWLQMVDKPLGIKEGGKRARDIRRGPERQGKQ